MAQTSAPAPRIPLSSHTQFEQQRVKRELISEITRTIQDRGITQAGAARLCQTDAPTLSKVLRGRLSSITIDRLADWLTALGRPVEIRVGRLIGPSTERARFKVVYSVEDNR